MDKSTRWFCAAVALLAAGFAPVAAALELPFSGLLSIEVSTLPVVPIAGVGVATLNPLATGLHLESAMLPAGVFSQAGFALLVTSPSALPIAGLQITAANAAGTLARSSGGSLGGVMSIHGVAKICLFAACDQGPPANVSVPVSVVGNGGIATAVGPVNVTVRGAPWTTATAAVAAISGRGSAMGPGGAASSTAQPGGQLNLVTPIFISTSIGAIGEVAALGRVKIAFEQPKPFCEVQLSQSSYGDGEVPTVTRLRFANPGSVAVDARLQVEIIPPQGAAPTFQLDENAVLPAGFDLDAGSNAANPVVVEQLRGTYSMRCRILDPNTAAVIAENVATFRLPPSPSPICEVAVNQPSYVDGDTLVFTSIRLANPGISITSVDVTLDIVTPVAGGVVYPLLDSVMLLPASFDHDSGPLTAAVISPDLPRGDYAFRCRLADPATGASLASDSTAFAIH